MFAETKYCIPVLGFKKGGGGGGMDISGGTISACVFVTVFSLCSGGVSSEWGSPTEVRFGEFNHTQGKPVLF